ncbi:MAG: hypothetical protein HZB16_18000 [Armatimonadetes bacterium]|nr:hypothetical protein [Armatimonadota bacterium]
MTAGSWLRWLLLAAIAAAAPDGSIFEPVDKPTAMYFAPPAEAPLLASPINTSLSTIATSEYHELLIIDDRLWAIGSNRAGMMGLGHAAPEVHTRPARVKVPDDQTFVTAAAGGYQSLAVDAQGRVWSFGGNQFGQRGDGSVPRPETLATAKAEDTWGVPVMLTSDADGQPFGGPADPVAQVISVLWFNLALMRSGAVYFWGMNGDDGAGNDSRGMVGDGRPLSLDRSFEARSVRRPTRVRFPVGVCIERLASSSSMAVAIDRHGALWTWGGGAGWGLGDGERGDGRGNSSTPGRLLQGRSRAKAALEPLPRYVDATATTTANFAIDADGDLWGWGMILPARGLGRADEWDPQGWPVKLTRTGNAHFASLDALLAQGHRLTSVQASLNSIHVLVDDGSLWGWGDAAMGEVGDGHIVNYLRVTPKDGRNDVRCAWDWGGTRAVVADATRIMTQVRWFATSQFSFHIVAMRRDGTLYTWGRNANGVLGNGLDPMDRAGPGLRRFAPLGETYTPNLLDRPYPVRVQPF